MGKTKKVGIAGRFGPRYGSRLRKQWRDITSKQKGINKCPKCNTKLPNMREFAGLWHCKKCGATWTGGTWESATARGKESHRIAIRMAREASEAEQNPASAIKK